MAKCLNCGKKGLFNKVNHLGLCSVCATNKIRNDDAKKTEDRAKNANKLLAEAIEQAKSDSIKWLENREKTLNSSISTLSPRVDELKQRQETLQHECELAERKLKSATNKLEKLKPAVHSIQNALKEFMDPCSERLTAVRSLNIDFDDLIGETPDLKCLSMKTLRSKYKKNEKEILELTKAYAARYTTKTNAALYKLMVLALNAEMNLILSNLRYGKVDDAIEKVKSITTHYYSIAADGNQTIVTTLNRFIGQIETYYIEAVKIEYEYYVQRERAKEEQRALREQMRQEAEERKQLEAEKKKVEAEEKKYQQEMDRIQQQLTESSEQSEIEKLKARISELAQMMESVNAKKAEIINLQNGKAGTVYIISNKGSFGDSVFKIGMTRRLEPQDRVNELGSASVPFPFDVHSFIFSEDAVSLESKLHKMLNSNRVNKVNLRKEFFRVSLDELEELVESIDPSAPFERTMLAEQYAQSLSIDSPVNEYIDLDDDD